MRFLYNDDYFFFSQASWAKQREFIMASASNLSTQAIYAHKILTYILEGYQRNWPKLTERLQVMQQISELMINCRHCATMNVNQAGISNITLMRIPKCARLWFNIPHYGFVCVFCAWSTL